MDVTEFDVSTETDLAATTRWINRTAGPAPVRGHALKRDKNGSYWCGCGHYIFWDSSGFERVKDQDALARQRHGLHLVQVHNQGRRS